MPDINPADLSRPSVSLSTPILATKSITVGAASVPKVAKTSQIVPARIDLEPAYTALKAAIGPEQWLVYKETTTNFFIGRLNQAEFSERIDPILASPTGEKEHYHNQLVAAIYGNVTRDLPDPCLAPWVSANDKPTSGVGSKPVTGDAAERRLKGEVMQLPSRDRRRIKDLAQNDFNPYEAMSTMFNEHHKSRVGAARTAEVPPSANGGLNRMNFDLEIKKRFAQPLAVESGEFPDTSNIEARMLPFCYEAGLVSGHAQDAATFMSVATETFVKEFLSSVFSRTRSNGPGDSGSAGLGVGWIHTQKYRKQLRREESAAIRGEITRDKSGLLPIEAKAASERGPLGMTDLAIALEVGDCGVSQLPILHKSMTYNYREAELENWDDYTYLDEHGAKRKEPLPAPGRVNGPASNKLPNGVDHGDAMDIDSDMPWEGGDDDDDTLLDAVLDSCLVGG